MEYDDLKIYRAVDPDSFAPMLVIKKPSTQESWRVRIEDMEDQKAILGDEFSIYDFIRDFEVKRTSESMTQDILHKLKEYHDKNGHEEYLKLVDQISNLKVEEIK